MTEDHSKPADGVEGEGPGVGEPGAPGIERGAALEGDENAIAAAANTSLDMDGFETGAGFELEDVPDEPGGDLELDVLDVRSSADELDLVEPVTPRAAEVGLPGLPTAEELPALSIDDGPPAAPTATFDEAGGAVRLSGVEQSGEAGEEVRFSGLERLERQRERSGGLRRLMAVASAVLLLVGAGLAMGYLGLVQIPGITPPDRSRFEVAAPVVLPGPQPETPVMSHVVLVDSWREAGTPLAWASALRERMPDLLGFVSVLSIDEERRFALVVGPAYSAAEANDLKGPLETAFVLVVTDPESWTVQAAPYSFFFGEYEGLGPANTRVQELAGLSVPAFVLQVGYSAGATAFRVYGGAFSDEFEAAEMGQLLTEHALDDAPLTERRGRLPD